MWNAQAGRWEWTAANEIQGACYSPTIPIVNNNTLAFWFKETTSSDFQLDTLVLFKGVLNIPDPCFGSGSGSNATSLAAVTHTLNTYPAMWCVVGTGFHADPFRALNATWALRQDRAASSPAWDNGGDGTHAPLVRLRLCQIRGWKLTMTLGPVEAAYTLPFTGSTFGPLHFPAGLAHTPSGGSVPLPPIIVSAI